MRVYDSFGPNPRALRMFLLEKKLEFPTETLDILAGDNRAAPYTSKNPGGQVAGLTGSRTMASPWRRMRTASPSR